MIGKNFFGLIVLEKVGRRPLLLGPLGVQILALGAMAMAFELECQVLGVVGYFCWIFFGYFG